MTGSYPKRKRIFERDNYTCHYCKRPADWIRDGRSPWGSFKKLITLYFDGDWQSFVLDHKIPRSRGGSNDDSNLVTSCAKCNGRKYDKPYEQFLKEIRYEVV